jgi:uncharacterized ParB-like nuclease family protein
MKELSYYYSYAACHRLLVEGRQRITPAHHTR